MNSYSFRSLSDIEFEEMCCDLLTQYLKIDFRTSPRGRDNGIDLQYRDDKVNVVVQIKHYCNSTFSNLKSSLKKEVDKVDSIAPTRYIVVTSLTLTPSNCDDVIAVINKNSTHITSTSDIIDLGKLNSILSRTGYEWIENKYYKLWLSSTNVMNRIYCNAEVNNISYLVKEISEESKLFVATKTYECALNQLGENSLLIIHGEPGIGKSTLAKMLVLKYLEDSYSLKFVSGNKLHQLNSILSPDENSKEVIFIDDFLGANFLELINSNSENELIYFIRRYIKSKSKKVILTTRTTIFNKACVNYEKLDRMNASIDKLLMRISDLNRVDKARILYNHCYFKLKDEYFAVISSNSRFLKIIDHPNYNPRLIEFITDKQLLCNIEPTKYWDFIDITLDNPYAIWKHEYLKKIGDEERFIIDTLFSLKGEAKIDNLEECYNSRYEYEIRKNSTKRKSNSFKEGIEVLANGFITIELDGENYIDSVVKFSNASITDFLLAYYDENKLDQNRVIESIVFIDQLFNFGLIQVYSFYDDEKRIKANSVSVKIVREVLLEKYDEIKVINKVTTSKFRCLSEFIREHYPTDECLLELEFEKLGDFIHDIGKAIKWGEFHVLNDLYYYKSKDSKVSRILTKNMGSLSKKLIKRATDIESFQNTIRSISAFDEQVLSKLLTEMEIRSAILLMIKNEIDETFAAFCQDESNYSNYLIDDEVMDNNITPNFDFIMLHERVDSVFMTKLNEIGSAIYEEIKFLVDNPNYYVHSLIDDLLLNSSQYYSTVTDDFMFYFGHQITDKADTQDEDLSKSDLEYINRMFTSCSE